MTELVHVDLDAEERALAIIDRRSKMLAKSSVVPRRYKNKPEDIAVAGLALNDVGVKLSPVSLKYIWISDGSPEFMAQLQIALTARHGHLIRFPDEECNTEFATAYIQLRGQSVEHRCRYTIEMARRRRLLDRWVERKVRLQGNTYDTTEKYFVTVRDEQNPVSPPDWARKEIEAGRIKQKDPWHDAPDAMLKNRAGTTLIAKTCPGVLMGIDELSFDDEVVEVRSPQRVDQEIGGVVHVSAVEDDDIADAELVDDVTPEAHDDSPDAHEYPERPVPPMGTSVAAGRRTAAAEQDPTPREPAGGDGPETVAAAPVEDDLTGPNAYAKAVHLLAHDLKISDEALDEIIHDVTNDVSANSITRDTAQTIVHRLRVAAGIEAA